MLESLNFKLFLLINAHSALHGYTLFFPVFLAKYCIHILTAGLALGWFWAPSYFRATLLTALIAVVAGAAANHLIAHLWFHPRPFMIPLGNNFLKHAPTTSFPSNHMTTLWAIAATFLMRKKMRLLGSEIAFLSLAIGWSRVYLGVHFPFDILGSMIVATLIVVVLKRFEIVIDQRLLPLIEKYYRVVFAELIQAKLIKA